MSLVRHTRGTASELGLTINMHATKGLQMKVDVKDLDCSNEQFNGNC